MAAYAAVVSVMNTMDAVMNDPCLSTCFDEKQIQSLREKLGVLLQFIENYTSLGRDKQVESLGRKILSAAHAAEEAIEKHIVDQIHAGVLEKKAPSFMIDLHQTIQDIDLIKEEVEKARGTNDEHPKYSTYVAAPPLITTGKTTMIGFDDYLLQLLDGLTGNESSLQVIPIVGMGGVGKTTLTKNAYENSLTVQHFDVRAWVSISQQYDVKNVLVQLLSTLGQSTEGEYLSDNLYKYLCGRRYLIVLDDMWSIRAWDKIKFCFPDNCNGSRIIVSTRIMEVANDLGSSRVVRVGLLDESKSWDLFCDKAFSQHDDQGYPAELEEIGKRIVQKCNGLPLSIVVIGAFLGKSSKEKEYWENIAENISSILSLGEDTDECLDILCLSYIHLPAHLKPCFLYLGTFPEDHEIGVSHLVKLLVSEGFIKPNNDQSLEEVAEGYINDLFERSLILVGSLRWNRNLETFRVHDLVRELCLREAEKENFIHVVEYLEILDELAGIYIDRERVRCIVVTGESMEDGQSFSNLSVARSLIFGWEGEGGEGKLPFLGSMLLRVLVVRNEYVNLDNTVKYFNQVNMRFLGYNRSCGGALPRSIFLLWNLQTLIFRHTESESEAPVEIWKLPQLRHVQVHGIRLPTSDADEEFVLHNLQTLMIVLNWRCSEEACKRIPNIKRLHLRYAYFSDENEYCLQWLNTLEFLSLELDFMPDLPAYGIHLLPNFLLPASLKELSIKGGNNWDGDVMRVIGLLPNLQYLNLDGNSMNPFIGREWKCFEGEFLSLKYLKIMGCCNLEMWDAESSHFPVLETLVLEELQELEEIPSSIGDIPTLTCIRVEDCSIGVNVSAMKILEEQEDLGNVGFQIQFRFFDEVLHEEFMEQVELMEGITCANFTVATLWR